MTEQLPINPKILRWARETAGYPLEEVATRLKKDVTIVQSWEEGKSSPTYVQLETLAYQIYKRPLALFFFPEPPYEETPEQAFRTLPEYEIQKIPPRLRYLLRQARVMQLNLASLYDGVNPAKRNILRELHYPPNVSAKKMAHEVRDYLDVALSSQFSWKSPEVAFKSWRNTLEEHGVFVFKESFNPHGKKRLEGTGSPFSGFCLYNHEFPVIYVNNNKSKTRQIRAGSTPGSMTMSAIFTGITKRLRCCATVLPENFLFRPKISGNGRHRSG